MAIDTIDQELCVGCGECVKSCAVDVIRLDEKEEKAVVVYPQDCMLCELCLFYCPTGAITFSHEKSLDVIVSWG